MTAIDYMCNKYEENKDLCKIWDEVKEMFSSFCNDPSLEF